MITSQGSLTIINAHTPEHQVYWNGQSVAHTALVVDTERNRVVLTVAEDPVLAEMAAAGIIIRRV
jgi:hypothetical protein